MYHALICNYVRILLKHMTNHSNILLDKSIMTSSPSLVASLARYQMAVPDWLLKRIQENQQSYPVSLEDTTIGTHLGACEPRGSST